MGTEHLHSNHWQTASQNGHSSAIISTPLSESLALGGVATHPIDSPSPQAQTERPPTHISHKWIFIDRDPAQGGTFRTSL
jgi:hypothetical protein